MEDKVKLKVLYFNGKKYYQGQRITLDIDTREVSTKEELEKLTQEVFKDAIYCEEEVSIEEAKEILKRIM